LIKVLWRPVESRPANADALEAAVADAVPAAEVTLTRADDGVWQVRALLPAAMCARGGDFASRDVSARVASVLEDHDCPARTFARV
jgi:hypothetical protein